MKEGDRTSMPQSTTSTTFNLNISSCYLYDWWITNNVQTDGIGSLPNVYSGKINYTVRPTKKLFAMEKMKTSTQHCTLKLYQDKKTACNINQKCGDA